MSGKGYIYTSLGVAFCLLLSFGAVAGYKAYRLRGIAIDLKTHVRYLSNNNETIGGAPADTTFSADYLGAIFGDDPELLSQLKKVVSRGISDSPLLNLGEVTAMVVTYHRGDDGKTEDVVAHIIGGFPLTKRKPGFHRDGYFRNLIDDQLWHAGDKAINMLGRDMIIFAGDDALNEQKVILEAVMSGNIMPLVDSLDKPLYYTAVFPDPHNVLPGQLRRHVQALVVKGNLAMYNGQAEAIILTASSRSARITASILSDMKIASEVMLRTKWDGEAKETPWGRQAGSWWAESFLETLHTLSFEKEESVVRAKTEFDRVMVNAVLKSIERMGRDLAQMRGSLDERKDPRLVDADLSTSKPGHYWSEEHRWGPNWPIPPPDSTNDAMDVASSGVPEQE